MSGAMVKTGKTSSKGQNKNAHRSRRARAVGDIVPNIGRASFRRFGFVQSSVVSRWPEIVGERYAEVSVPEAIRFPVGQRSNGVLRLCVVGAHATMMQHIAPTIIERVNRFFGYPAVARLVIEQGTVAPGTARAAPQRTVRPVPEQLGASLREIADPELRACLEGLAGSVAAAQEDENAKQTPSQQLQVKRLGDIGRDIGNGVNER